METEWKPVVEYEGLYEVSNFGEIRSLDRFIKKSPSGRMAFVHGKIIKQFACNERYLKVSLSKNGNAKTHRVARVVASVFLDNKDSKGQVNHKDGNRFNNKADNLEWATQEENMRHAVKAGLHPPQIGEDHGCAILNEDDVRKIRTLVQKGIGYRPLGAMFGVDHSTIYRIVHRKTWVHI
jgi:hypothetical protein